MSSIAILRIPSESPEQDPSAKAIGNLAQISNEFFDRVLLFEDQFKDTNADIVDIQRRRSTNLIPTIFLLCVYQMQLSYHLFKNRDNLDMVLLHAGGFLLFLPIIVCKLLRISVTVGVIGEPYKGYAERSSGSLQDKIATKSILIAEIIAYRLADVIAVFSPDMSSYEPLEPYWSKCQTVRFNFETVPDDIKPISKRSISVVFLGRITSVKGADRAYNAVERVATQSDREITVRFIGDGTLLSDLKDRRPPEIADSVRFTGWVSQEEVSNLLRDSVVLLLPSRSEGLPKALLEAMAVGVVPIVTPVGDIPSVVNDDNGVLLKEPTAKQIAETLSETLDRDDLDKISQNSREMIRKNFGFETAKKDFATLMRECKKE